jgi:hypothetical protein
MVARTNGGVAAGQVLVGSLSHFVITTAGDASAKLGVDGAVQKVLEMIATKSTVVMLGDVDATDFRVAVESSTAWTAAEMQVALRALGTVDGVDFSSDSVADFTY